MVIFNEGSRLSEAIFADSSLIAVLGRLGVHLGVGDETIGEACVRLGIDTDFFVAIINTFLNPEYFPASTSKKWDSDLLKLYLKATRDSYTQTTLPNIERHLSILISRSGTNNNLGELHRFFLMVKEEIERCAEMEKKMEQGDVNQEELMRDISAGWSNAEDQLSDLASFFVIHLRGEYDTNLCVAVVNAIFTLQKDMRQNNRLRRRLLNSISGNK